MLKNKFNKDWQFCLGTRWNDRLSRKVNLPHDWSVDYPRDPNAPCGGAGGYFKNGEGIYKKFFTVPEDFSGKKVYIEFDGVYMNSTVKINGNILGFHPYGYTGFYYELTPYLNKDGGNVLEVLVANCPPNSRWYSGSGIYRDVWIMAGADIHIRDWGVFVSSENVKNDSAKLNITTAADNAGAETKCVTVVSTVMDKAGNIIAKSETQADIAAGGGKEIHDTVDVTGIELWSVEKPVLYTLKSEVYCEGLLSDTSVTDFGIRSLSFSAQEGFLLNGKSITMKGGCIHHDNGIIGAASYDHSEERRVQILKQSGFDAVRCAHNPPSTAFLNSCDKLGMLVIDETFDCWRDGKSIYDYNMAFEDWWRRDTQSMIFRDRNHPSVIMWSIGNEIPERNGSSDGFALCKTMADYARSLDSTRPVTMAVCDLWDRRITWDDIWPFFEPLDVCGYNYLWYKYEDEHKAFPDRVIAGTETYPTQAFETWEKTEQLPYVIGDFVWTAMDYFGESGLGKVFYENEMRRPDPSGALWHVANCGDIDMCGNKRPQSYYRDALWNVSKTPYIAVHRPTDRTDEPRMSGWGWADVLNSWTWTGWEDKTVKVEIYARCEKVELFLNGESVGEKPIGHNEKYRTIFEVPYVPGELKAVGYAENGEKYESVIKTAGKAAKLRLTANRDKVRNDEIDLAYITCELVDENGIIVPNSDKKVYFTVSGAGRLLAVGNGNPRSDEMYTGNMRTTYNGLCMAVIASAGDGDNGKITLHAQADGMEPVYVTVETE